MVQQTLYEALGSFSGKVSIEQRSDVLSSHPDQAAKIMGVIAVWSQIELSLSNVLCEFLKSDPTYIIAMYTSVQNQSARRAMVDSAAKVALVEDGEGLALFRDVVKAIESTRNTRNLFAHSIWAMCPQLDGGFVLIDPRHVSKHDAALSWAARCYPEDDAWDGAFVQLRKTDADMHEKALWYSYDDLDREFGEAERALHLMTLLLFSFDNSARLRADSRHRLRKDLQAQV